MVSAVAALTAETAQAAPASAATLPPAKYTLSVNLELMFPKAMPWEERLEITGKEGAKAYSFWAFAGKNLENLRAIQDRYGLKCGSITGTNKTGWGNGLTKTGGEKAFLDDFSEACAAAKKVQAENLITFVGITQKDIPWETQMEQIVAGLKKAGDIAGANDVYLTLEPLNAVESPQMAMVTSGRAYEIVERVAHPRVKVDFDLYHRQLGEGNLINTLKNGLHKGYVRFVEVGDVPGRFEPGTGEVDYARLFRVLREVGLHRLYWHGTPRFDNAAGSHSCGSPFGGSRGVMASTSAVKIVNHVNIVVADMERSLAFYVGLLGMRPTFEVELNGDWIDTVAGLNGVSARCVFVQPMGGGARFELLQYVLPTGAHPDVNEIANTTGLRHVALEVDDLAAWHTRLSAAGVVFLSPPVEVPFSPCGRD